MTTTRPTATWYQRYLDALHHGNRHLALEVARMALVEGMDIRDLYLSVFQPALYEIGRLWEYSQINVAQEHIATSITRTVMAQTYALATSRMTPLRMFMRALNRTMVAACVGSNLHEIGLRMVADFFELEGWNVYYLGAGMPTSEIVQVVNERQTHILAISATLNSQVSVAYDLIQKVRATPAGTQIKIMVGGAPFNHVPGLSQKIGADLTAVNAREALRRATLAMAQPGRQPQQPERSLPLYARTFPE